MKSIRISMNIKAPHFFTALVLSSGLLVPQSGIAQKKAEEPNDFNTPLHLLSPSYKVPYGVTTTVEIKKRLDRILKYLDKATPERVIDKVTQKEVKDRSVLNQNAQLAQGAFRLTSYEWGVTYSGMLEAAQATGDSSYWKYTKDRFQFFVDYVPYFRALMDNYGVIDPQMKQILTPHALDDAGAMAASMIKAQMIDDSLNMQPIIKNYINYIMYKEYRLSDGTFARNRPQHNTLWLDDLYMSVPALVRIGQMTREMKYFNEATRQIKQFAQRMFVSDKGLFKHGWVEGMQEHPSFFWGRANGWAILTLTETLDALPSNHPDQPYILELFRRHIKGIVSFQSGDGFWHQLLDRNDSYKETSATAIYVYCLAKGINKGWIDAQAYGPAALLGWNAVSTKINATGQVEDTCVGTGMAFDPSYYYYRPTHVFAAHGYGPVLLAGAEMINLLNKQHPKMNDNAIQFYDENFSTSAPIFSVTDSSRPEEISAGSTRKTGKPVLFLIGDSTVKNGRGKGDNGQWGWGSFFEQFFNTNEISIENHALGGRSSRTFFTEGLWDKVLSGIQKGDYLLMQFGHNDGGPLNTGRARASLNGTGEQAETVIMESNGSPETVYTYGHYLRLFIRQAKARGAHVIVLSPTPGNRWKNGKINRMTESYTSWAKTVAQEESVDFIDLNDISADKFDKMGEAEAKKLYIDSVHTTDKGAILNGNSVVEGIQTLTHNLLHTYLK